MKEVNDWRGSESGMRVVEEGEGVKVNRCIIIVLLNKHTCVQASSSRLIKIEFL